MNISVSETIDIIGDGTGVENDTGSANTQVPMIRGVPNRRTFDSGYGGDSQSCVSSPIAEQKKRLDNGASLTTGESFISQASRESGRSRARLRRQKAVDRGSAPSSAQSRGRANTANSLKNRQVANSSTDYEENDDDYDDH